MISFRLAKHRILPGVSLVEVLKDGQMVASLYPEGEDGIKLISAHISESSTDEGFHGEVVEDDGSLGWPPIPAHHVKFHPKPYRIEGSRLIRQDEH